MGISMLENSEMGAFAPSRMGNKSFVNDSDVDFSNFSIVNKKKEAQKAKDSLNKEYAINPKYANDCNYLQQRLIEINNRIESNMSNNPSKVLFDRFTAPLNEIAQNYKNAIAKNRCVEIAEADKQAAQQKETLDVLASVAATPPPIIPQDEASQKASAMNKYIIYGVGGVILLIGIVILIKK
jgi:hypothetical protein